VYTICPPHIAKYLASSGRLAHVVAMTLEALDTAVVADSGGGDMGDDGGDTEP
jgi:hypothetical protein